MVKPTAAQQREIAELEDHAATLGRLLDILRLGLHNARDPRTIREIEAEITYTIERLAEVQARRDRLRRDLDKS
jgi:hypothetical protein